MRSSSTRTTNSRGFTLIEILIIAPIVIIAISGFVAVMISLVGKTMLTRDQSLMAYNINDGLGRIEEDVRLSAKFLTTTGSLPSPQGKNNDTTAFTNGSNTLILNALATDSNPRTYDRWLMYYDNQPNPCGSTETFNKIFTIKIIYFVDSNGTLWRRTYVPPWNLNNDPPDTPNPDANTICTASSAYYPWQRNSCAIGQTSSQCQTQDEKIMDNVSSLNVKYYTNPGDTSDLGSSSASSAGTVEVTITGAKTTAGQSFTSSGSLRATKLNNLDT